MRTYIGSQRTEKDVNRLLHPPVVLFAYDQSAMCDGQQRGRREDEDTVRFQFGLVRNLDFRKGRLTAYDVVQQADPISCQGRNN